MSHDDSDSIYPRALADAYVSATYGPANDKHAVQVGTEMHLWLLKHGFRIVRIDGGSPMATIHLCCGCSCHVCADGHGGSDPQEPHTDACWERLASEQGIP